MLQRGVLAASVLASALSCFATSRVGEATVSDVDGLPCFTIDAASRAQRRVRLSALLVSEQTSESWQRLPTELWGFRIAPPGSFIELPAVGCIRYGVAPPSAQTRTAAQPLVPGRVYVVSLSAHIEGEAIPTVGYKAEFCVKRLRDGATRVQVVEWDRGANRWLYEACTTP